MKFDFKEKFLKVKNVLLLAVLVITISCNAQSSPSTASVKDTYLKIERMIPMRDGIKLFTAIYMPRDTSEKYPFLIMRTPYSCAPYGEDNYNTRRLGPNRRFAEEKFIFVYQDVRGRYMSEGNFEEMTPAINASQAGKKTDESTDAYDTVDWLLKNIANNNGNAGLYGISYPGFYAAAALPNAHPAIKAVSPQAPVTDEFEGDDAYHRGAFFLMDNFGFLNYFDHPRKEPWKKYPSINNNIEIKDAYEFFLKLGPIKNANDLYFNNRSKIWNEYLAHNTKDSYWQARNIRTSLKDVQPAVLVVGGWFDAEDLFGALNTYKAIEQQTPVNNNHLIMGPWTHGAWAANSWTSFVNYDFGGNTNTFFQQLEFNFFTYYLKGKGSFTAAEASIFFTGSNEWKSFSQWPAPKTTKTTLFLGNDKSLQSSTQHLTGFDEYTSDPADPVPYIKDRAPGRLDEYMAADQTFASRRPDVLSYTGQALQQNFTIAGTLTANLYVSIEGSDADFIVKLIDVEPDGDQTQQLVRAEVLRGKFRNSFEKPEAFTAEKVTEVKLQLNDVAHTFLKGHKIMVQVQSTWFPLVDRNPQQFMNISEAEEKDFKKIKVRLYHSRKYPSAIEMYELK
ncbi:CocE/NonD family hydrolase [Foetidibacter luteolus]|uniref:CocE/NonD family hydrolase n=1 Tax=Foetidibacter luteolus TaxID=2608880 RepID=UPI00129B486D|nr:CocE/NonD family hydrolase [Foetidibacter luteolus]